MSKAELETSLRNFVLEKLAKFIDTELNADPIIISASAFSIPMVDAEGNEKYVNITVSVPRGTRNDRGGYDPYDGYAAGEEYRAEQEEKAAKKAASEAKKKAEAAARERKRAERKAKKEAEENPEE